MAESMTVCLWQPSRARSASGAAHTRRLAGSTRAVKDGVSLGPHLSVERVGKDVRDLSRDAVI